MSCEKFVSLQSFFLLQQDPLSIGSYFVSMTLVRSRKPKDSRWPLPHQKTMWSSVGVWILWRSQCHTFGLETSPVGSQMPLKRWAFSGLHGPSGSTSSWRHLQTPKARTLEVLSGALAGMVGHDTGFFKKTAIQLKCNKARSRTPSSSKSMLLVINVHPTLQKKQPSFWFPRFAKHCSTLFLGGAGVSDSCHVYFKRLLFFLKNTVGLARTDS